MMRSFIVAAVFGCAVNADSDTKNPASAINSECNQDAGCKNCDPRCDEWAAAGHCNEDPPTCGGVGSPPCSPADAPEAYPNWMKVNCEVSCDTCTSEVTKAATAADPAANCAAWAAAGECDKNEAYMTVHCMAACGVTEAPDAKLTEAPAAATEDTGKAGKSKGKKNEDKSSKSGKPSTDGKSGKSKKNEGKKGKTAEFKKGPQRVMGSSTGATMGVAAAGLVGLAVVGTLARKSSSDYSVVEPVTEGTQFV